MMLLPHLYMTLLTAYVTAAGAAMPVYSLPHYAEYKAIKDFVIQSDILNQKDIKYLTRYAVGRAVLGDKDSTVKGENTLSISMDRADFRPDEPITLKIVHESGKSLQTKLTDSMDRELSVPMEGSQEGDTFTLKLLSMGKVQPGKYTITVTDESGGKVHQDVTWGMLTFNKQKTDYRKEEFALFSAEAFTEQGEADCDAQVSLKITKPDMTDDNVTMQSNCAEGSMTLKPSFETAYSLRQKGQYHVTVYSDGKAGRHEVSDTFTVGEKEDFAITRGTKTHIYNGSEATMAITIAANTDFAGTIVETVPADLEILPGGAMMSYDTITTIASSAAEKTVLSPMLMDNIKMPFDGAYSISQGFGSQATKIPLLDYYIHLGLQGHDGTDFALPMETPVYAVDDGIVLFAGPGDYGNTVVIQHAWGRSYYGHLSKVTTMAGVSVLQGMDIGLSGTSGDSTGPHLHLGFKPNHPDTNNGYGGKVDPMQFLQQKKEAKPVVLGDRTTAASPSAVPDASQSASLTQYTDEVLTPAPTGIQPSPTGSKEEVTTASAEAEQQRVDTEVKAKLKEEQPVVEQNVKLIKWNVQLKRGEKKQLQYRYRLPAIYPQTFTLGNIKLFNTTTKSIVFAEDNVWKVTGQKLEQSWADSSWQTRKPIVIDHTTLGMPGIDMSSKAQSGDQVSSLSWKHTINENDHRLLVVGVHTGGKRARNVSYGMKPLVQLTQKNCVTGGCHNEIWYTVDPKVGTETVSVTLEGEDTVVAGSTGMYDVSPTDTFGEVVSDLNDIEAKKGGKNIYSNQMQYALLSDTQPAVAATHSALWEDAGVQAAALSNGEVARDAYLQVGINPFVKPSQLLLLPLPTATKKQLLTDDAGKELEYRVTSSKKKSDKVFAWVTVTGLREKQDTHLYLYTDYLPTGEK